ncbi:MAG: ABC transporter permease [Deltaproteobacteria bacterium]|nr:ABC transporter permease [Deltaproteobacteria bacterium]
MFYGLEKGITDIKQHKFLAFSTIITISFAALIISMFMLIFVNTGKIADSFKKNVKIMIYLKQGNSEKYFLNIESEISKIKGVEGINFISKEKALNNFKTAADSYAFLFDSFEKNPLPDAYQIMVNPAYISGDIKSIVEKLKNIEGIEDILYAQKWIEKFNGIFSLLKLLAIVTGSVFFAAAIFFAGNTIRLVLYSRREEIEIMRLVGANDAFITAPFYIQSFIYGILGGALGIFITYIIFNMMPADILKGFLPDTFMIDFLNLKMLAEIIFGGVLVGWGGCFISLKQFLKV